MFKFSWEIPFFETGDTKVFLEIGCFQVMKSKLTYFQGGRIEDHRIMCIKHLHLPQ